MQCSHFSHSLIVKDSQGQREISLNSPVYSIGRDAKCDIRLACRFVSRHHATLIQFSGRDKSISYGIMDGDLQGNPSANGILINGRKRQNHILTNEDHITFGPQVEVTYHKRELDTNSDDLEPNPPKGPRLPQSPYLGGSEFGAATVPDDGTSCIL